MLLRRSWLGGIGSRQAKKVCPHKRVQCRPVLTQPPLIEPNFDPALLPRRLSTTTTFDPITLPSFPAPAPLCSCPEPTPLHEAALGVVALHVGPAAK